MGILDAQPEEAQSKTLPFVLIGLVALCLIGVLTWFLVRYNPEKKTVREFMGAVIAGDMQHAYHIWKPQGSYAFKDFMDDWGPSGYYGPVKSYRIKSAGAEKRSTAIVIVVDVSPFAPFPDDGDDVEQNKTKEVHLWVERTDQSISFPPF
jgi:hypothetical protein